MLAAAVVIFICAGSVDVKDCNETTAIQTIEYPKTDETDLEKCRNVTAWVAQMAIRPREGEYIKWRCQIGVPVPNQKPKNNFRFLA